MGQTIVTNKKALRDYFISEKWECGIELIGAEVKSIRAGHVSFKDTFARVEKGQVLLYNLHIEPYQAASYENVAADRVRRLLLHRREIKKMDQEVTLKNQTLIPTRLYYNNRGLVKVEVGLAKGKKQYDKREVIKTRQIDRDLKRALRGRNRR